MQCVKMLGCRRMCTCGSASLTVKLFHKHSLYKSNASCACTYGLRTWLWHTCYVCMHIHACVCDRLNMTRPTYVYPYKCSSYMYSQRCIRERCDSHCSSAQILGPSANWCLYRHFGFTTLTAKNILWINYTFLGTASLGVVWLRNCMVVA